MDVRIITIISVILLALIFGSIVCFAVFENKRRLYQILKTFPILCLIVAFIIVYPEQYLIYIALVLAGFGDLCLAIKNNKLFYVGTVSFFLSHLVFTSFYFVTTYNSIGYIPIFYYIISPLILVLLITISGILFFKKIKILSLLAPLYFSGLFINLFLVISLICLTKELSLLIVIFGFLWFIASDILIALRKFKVNVKHHDFLVISTYYVAQILIALGLFIFFL